MLVVLVDSVAQSGDPGLDARVVIFEGLSCCWKKGDKMRAHPRVPITWQEKSMKRSFSLFALALGLVAFASLAQGAPVEYVKVLSLYGAGWYYIPGTDT